jgi:hypothetical protein
VRVRLRVKLVLDEGRRRNENVQRVEASTWQPSHKERESERAREKQEENERKR